MSPSPELLHGTLDTLVLKTMAGGRRHGYAIAEPSRTGVVAALAASRVLTSQLFGVIRTDPLTIGAVVATLIGVALVASAVPARRAAAVDPTRALQSE
jgi:ABC-type antimicrobial peptide transport system permease subunit